MESEGVVGFEPRSFQGTAHRASRSPSRSAVLLPRARSWGLRMAGRASTEAPGVFGRSEGPGRRLWARR